MRRPKAVKADAIRSFTLLQILKLYRYKIVTNGLMALPLLLFAAAVASASPPPSSQNFSYKAKLGRDLDGDHIPETATIRQRGSFYQVSIHFTTGRPKLRIKTYITNDIAGLTLEVSDVDHDTRADLVINSATSLLPVAVWLNRGAARFQQVRSSLYGPVGGHSGPRWIHRETDQPEQVGNLLSDPLPQVEPADCFHPGADLQNILLSNADPLPFDFRVPQAAPRGPPTETQI